jgi:hypothetical protein
MTGWLGGDIAVPNICRIVKFGVAVLQGCSSEVEGQVKVQKCGCWGSYIIAIAGHQMLCRINVENNIDSKGSTP